MNIKSRAIEINQNLQATHAAVNAMTDGPEKDAVNSALTDLHESLNEAFQAHADVLGLDESDMADVYSAGEALGGQPKE